MIANLTQHRATKEQVEAGVVDLVERENEIKALLTFDDVPSMDEMNDRAERLARIVKEEGTFSEVMIGGAPFFMSTLERVLKKEGFQPVYAFSKRVVVEEKEENGEVVKKNVFKHQGFVRV